MFYIVISYFIGTILFAALVGKLKKVNLQQANSGNLGARNAGRTLGKSAFVVVAVGDGLKGLLVVVMGRMLEMSEPMIACAVLAVILGHLYPFWNKGRGGKGVATLIGAMIAFSPFYFVLFFVCLGVSMLLTRSATLSMVIGFIIYGVIISFAVPAGGLMAIALVLVMWKQRKSIMERVRPNVLE